LRRPYADRINPDETLLDHPFVVPDAALADSGLIHLE
jgi:hypothetical protein